MATARHIAEMARHMDEVMQRLSATEDTARDLLDLMVRLEAVTSSDFMVRLEAVARSLEVSIASLASLAPTRSPSSPDGLTAYEARGGTP